MASFTSEGVKDTLVNARQDAPSACIGIWLGWHSVLARSARRVHQDAGRASIRFSTPRAHSQ
jgi:hypothetical protein